MDKKHCRVPVLSFLAALLLFAVLAPAVARAEDDTSKGKGCVSIQLQDIGTPMKNVEFRCYRVGQPVNESEQIAWELVSELEKTGVDLNQLKTASALHEAAKTLQKAVETEKLTGVAATTDNAGKLQFEGLDDGVYLVVQTNRAQYGWCEPFLAAVPYSGENGALSYKVEASVKGTLEETPTNTPKPSATPEPDDESGTASHGVLPQTGALDEPALWLVFMCVAGVALFALLARKKVSKNR